MLGRLHCAVMFRWGRRCDPRVLAVLFLIFSFPCFITVTPWAPSSSWGALSVPSLLLCCALPRLGDSTFWSFFLLFLFVPLFVVELALGHFNWICVKIETGNDCQLCSAFFSAQWGNEEFSQPLPKGRSVRQSNYFRWVDFNLRNYGKRESSKGR